MKKKLAKLILGGRGYQSYYMKERNHDETGKQKMIEAYRAIFLDDQDYIVVSEKTTDKFVVDYADDHVVGIFRQIIREGETIMEPFHGLFCIVWFEKKKTFGKMHFLWSVMWENEYQYVELSCLGIEQEIVMALCDILFSHLKSLVRGAIAEKIKMIEATPLSSTPIVEDEKCFL